jgi:hypothetical protein
MPILRPPEPAPAIRPRRQAPCLGAAPQVPGGDAAGAKLGDVEVELAPPDLRREHSCGESIPKTRYWLHLPQFGNCPGLGAVFCGEAQNLAYSRRRFEGAAARTLLSWWSRRSRRRRVPDPGPRASEECLTSTVGSPLMRFPPRQSRPRGPPTGPARPLGEPQRVVPRAARIRRPLTKNGSLRPVLARV